MRPGVEAASDDAVAAGAASTATGDRRAADLHVLDRTFAGAERRYGLAVQRHLQLVGTADIYHRVRSPPPEP